MTLPRPARATALAPRLALGLALSLGLCPGLALADANAPESRRVLLDAAGPAPASPSTTWRDLEEFLARGPEVGAGLAGGTTLPDADAEAVLDRIGALSCGTALVRAAERALPRAEGTRATGIARLLAPPAYAAEGSVAGDETITVRYDTSVASRHAVSRRDLDGDRVPDLAQAAALESREIADRLATLLGVTPGALRLDIDFAASPYAEGAALPGAPPVIVLPRDLRGAEATAALAHQIAHAMTRDLAPDLPASFEEAVATWLGETVLAEREGLRLLPAQLLPARHPARSLFSPGIGEARGDAAFLRFTTDVLALPHAWVGDAIADLPRRLDEARRSPRIAPADAPLAALAEALDGVLSRHGLTLAEAVAEYQSWSLEQDLLRRGLSTSVDVELDMLPEEVRIDPGDIPAFGQRRFGVQLPPGGGVELAFESAEPLTSSAIVLMADGTVRRIPLSGSRGITLPASALRRVIVLVQSPTIPRGLNRWQVPGMPATPGRLVVRENLAWPFVLTALSAEPAPGQVTLSWETASEEDMTGWIVERALRPSGPWLVLSAAPLPAQSFADAAASYAFVDATPRPSLRYHYRVRALTRGGLADLTPTTSLRTLPAPR